MKNKLVFATMIVILLGGSISTSIADTPVDNGLAVGDHFTFDGDGHSEDNSYRVTEMTNASGGEREFYEEEISDRLILESSSTDVDIIKDRPLFDPVPDPIDTLLSADTFGESQPGSHENWTRNEHRHTEGGGGTLEWFNSSDTYDLSGQQFGDDNNDDVENYSSNSTYAIIFPEMTMTNFHLEDFNLFVPTTFDWNLPLLSRTLTTGTDSFDINGGSHSINYVLVNQTFGASHSETTTEYVVFGDQNDENAPGTDMDVQIEIDIYVEFYYVYDTANTMVVGVGQFSFFDIWISYSASNFEIDFEPENPDNPVSNYDFESFIALTSVRNSYTEMTSASPFYGNTRATNSGSSPLEDGDQLVYNFEQYQAGELNFESQFGNENENGFVSYVSETDATLTFDVFRHSNDFFEAVIFMEGSSEGEFNQDGDIETFGPEPAFFADIFRSPSTDENEIMTFFPENMHFRDFFRCDGPDCGDDFYPQFPHDASATTGSVNVTDWEADLTEMDTGDPLIINGNNFYYFNVTTHQLLFERSEILSVDIPIDQQQGIWEVADMELNFQGIVAFHYDRDTGALVAYEESFYGEVNIDGEWSVEFEPGQFTDVSIHATIVSQYGTNFQLMEHPHYYDVGQEIIEDTPTEDPSNTTEDDSPGLELPVPIVPIVASLSIVAVFVTRRRR